MALSLMLGIMIYRLCAIVMMLCAVPTAARADSDIFTVYLNDIPTMHTTTVRPCYPVMARFEHPDPAVTRVRMRYPHNHAMFMHFPMNEDVHIELHEDYMKRGKLSLSDFIAEDDAGAQYGLMTLTFIPVDPTQGQFCDGHFNS